MLPIRKIRGFAVKLLAGCTVLLLLQTVRLHLQQVTNEGLVGGGKIHERSANNKQQKQQAALVPVGGVVKNTWDVDSAQQKVTSDKVIGQHRMGTNHTKLKESERPYISTHLKDVNLTEYHLALLQSEKLQTTKRMIYNRVPKCGSITMWQLISQISRKKHFHVVASSIYDPPWVDEAEQQRTVVHINGLREPFIYNRHLCFLDFLKFGYQMPVYINLVRNPVDRFVSSFYYQRDLHKKKLTKAEYAVDVNECLERNFTHCTLKGTFVLIPYFCGHGEECLQRTSSALTKAKENAAQYYGAVGLLEDFESFLKLLGCVMPQHFDGIAQLYKGRKSNTTKDKGAKLTDINRQKLSEHMKLELEFYYFLKARFYFLKDMLNTQCHL